MKISLDDLMACKFWTIGSLCEKPKNIPQVISYFVFVCLRGSKYGSVFEYMDDGTLIWQFNYKFRDDCGRWIIEINYPQNKKEHRIMLGILIRRDASGKYKENDEEQIAYDIEKDESIKLSDDILKHFLKEVNMTEEFHGPEGHRDADEKDYQDSQSQSRTDWDKIFYKPVSGDENLVRILPGIGTARYHFKGGKHFIKHPDKTEMFVCNLETYGKPCPACEEFDRLTKDEKSDDAKPFKPSVKGVFNVIDRTDPERGVVIWECPPVAVWERIIGLVKGKSKFNDLVGSEDDPLAGRDVVVIFNPKATPQFMYDLQFDAVSQLGKKKEVAAWLASARPLDPKVIYPEVDYDVAKIKTFGSKEEREELRKKLAEQYEAKAKKEEKKEKVKADDEKAEDLKKKNAELEKQIADMKAGGTGKGEAKEEVKEKVKETPEEREERLKKEEVQKAEDAPEEDEDDKKEEIVEEKPESSIISDLRKQLAEAEEKEAKEKEPEPEEKKEEVKAEEKKEETKEEDAEEKEEPQKGEETPEELALKIAKIRSKHEA